MNTDGFPPAPFPFQQETLAPEPPKPPRRGRKSAPKGSKAPAAPKKPGRRPPPPGTTPLIAEITKRDAPAARRPRKARPVRIDLATAMSALAGLTPDDAKFVTGVVQAMQPFGKQSRARIVVALGKLVG